MKCLWQQHQACLSSQHILLLHIGKRLVYNPVITTEWVCFSVAYGATCCLKRPSIIKGEKDDRRMTKREGGKERLNGADLETHCFTTHTQICSLDPCAPCCHGNAVDGFLACSSRISIFEQSPPHNCLSNKTHTFHCCYDMVESYSSINSLEQQWGGARGFGLMDGAVIYLTGRKSSSYVCRSCIGLFFCVVCKHKWMLHITYLNVEPTIKINGKMVRNLLKMPIICFCCNFKNDLWSE